MKAVLSREKLQCEPSKSSSTEVWRRQPRPLPELITRNNSEEPKQILLLLLLYLCSNCWIKPCDKKYQLLLFSNCPPWTKKNEVMNVNDASCQLRRAKLVIFSFLFVEILFMINLELVPSTDQFNIKHIFILDVAKIQSFFLSVLVVNLINS